MKQKIGTCECGDCGYADCDVGLDKNGHPYTACWGECDGERWFTMGKAPKIRRLLGPMKFAPLPGKPTVAELREKYGITAPPSVEPPKPAPAPAAKKKSGLLIDE